jgi:deoxyribodipyrimidine photolyase-related protein
VILLIFPHQLFARHPGLELKPELTILLEDSLFFGDPEYPVKFHQQKLWLHRASMKRYESDLQARGFATRYLECRDERPLLQTQLERLAPKYLAKGATLGVVHPVDFILEQRLRAACEQLGLACEFLPNPGFLNTQEENRTYRGGKNRWFMADFYKWQRQRLDILMDNGEPAGGQWSFDKENRKKVPKKLLKKLPQNLELKRDSIDHDARHYIAEHFPDNPGALDELYYPSSHRAARRWLKHFLENRLACFGDYEDAIVEGESWLWHSVLTPAMNTGLLTPEEIVKALLSHADKHSVPLNSLEGFVRQVIGWREFMRATYEDLGVRMRTANHWQHHRKMPDSLYSGSTGIAPIDDTIHRIRATGYCHHIERLMVLGGFMFLCEIDPDEIYQWFMAMFIDSYDWVMVPNVYAMSQNADGGLITTKPYFSGSSYIRKMSHYQPGDWCETWDGLYWRWIWNHADALGRNPRWAMMCSMVRKMDTARRNRHLERAESFLAQLS